MPHYRLHLSITGVARFRGSVDVVADNAEAAMRMYDPRSTPGEWHRSMPMAIEFGGGDTRLVCVSWFDEEGLEHSLLVANPGIDTYANQVDGAEEGAGT